MLNILDVLEYVSYILFYFWALLYPFQLNKFSCILWYYMIETLPVLPLNQNNPYLSILCAFCSHIREKFLTILWIWLICSKLNGRTIIFFFTEELTKIIDIGKIFWIKFVYSAVQSKWIRHTNTFGSIPNLISKIFMDPVQIICCALLMLYLLMAQSFRNKTFSICRGCQNLGTKCSQWFFRKCGNSLHFF